MNEHRAEANSLAATWRNGSLGLRYEM